MIIVGGLGNPGDKYAGNRHNIGFMTLSNIANFYNFAPWRDRFQALTSEGAVSSPDGERLKVLLVKPMTFYNDSGRSIGEAARFFKRDPEDVIIFHDEIDLSPGRLRVKSGGGHSGNNGIRSVIQHLSNDVRRVRMGVGHPGHKDRVQGHVLSDFSKLDQVWLDPMIDACARALPFLISGQDDRFQADVMRLAPAPKTDQSKRNPEG